MKQCGVTDSPVDYDVLVVGARCAGAPTAMLLAQRGYRVLMVDRAVFPKDTMSSHYIHAYGVARLARWGLLPDLLATGCPPVKLLSGDWGNITLTGSPPPYDGIDFGVCPRRYVLDHLLNTAAVRSGAELEEGLTVTGLLSADGRVTGVRGRTRSGAETRITARYVVGADGMRSLVARAVGATEYWTVPPLTTTYYTYFEDLPMDRLLIHWRTGRCVPAVPTHNGLTVVLCGWSYDGWREYRSDIRRHFFETVRTQSTAEFAERVSTARRAALRRHPPLGQLLPQTLRTGLGAGRRRRLPQGPRHGAGNGRRLPGLRTARGGPRPNTVGAAGGRGRPRRLRAAA